MQLDSLGRAPVEREFEMMRFIKPLAADNRGFTLVEYALLAALVVLASVVILTSMGTSMSTLYNGISNKLTTA
jgi:pilus assembly protein Flp/PilA